jgi:hypothetical protein
LFEHKKLKIMNDRQSRELAAFETGLQYMDNHDTIWNTFTAIQTQRDALETSIDRIEMLDGLSITDKKGYSTQKETAKTAMCNQAFSISQPIAGWALIKNMQVLYEEMNFPITGITKAKDSTAQEMARTVHERGTTHLAALTADGIPVTAGGLAMLDTQINDFDVFQPQREAAISEQQSINNQETEEFKKARTIRDSILLLCGGFRESHRDFYDGLIDSFKMIDTGVRHVSIDVRVKDDATLVYLPRVDVKIVETGQMKKTSKVGRTFFMSLPNGNYTLSIQYAGYEPQTISNIGVTEGVIARVEVMLKKG